MTQNPHEAYMKLALKQAELAFEKNEVPVGAVIVHKGKIVARAHNQMEMLHDPTAHAEMIALTQASETLSGAGGTANHRGSLEGATMYVTLEPCPMCAGALVISKCENLVYGAKDLKAGAVESLYKIPSDERLNHQLNITTGVMEEECRSFLTAFFKNLRKEKR